MRNNFEMYDNDDMKGGITIRFEAQCSVSYLRNDLRLRDRSIQFKQTKHP